LTRRTLMRLAGAALPADVIRAAEPASAVMTKLSSYMSEASERALPAEVIEKVKHHILDTFAAMISGSELAPGRSAIQFARAYGGETTSQWPDQVVRRSPSVGSWANTARSRPGVPSRLAVPGPQSSSTGRGSLHCRLQNEAFRAHTGVAHNNAHLVDNLKTSASARFFRNRLSPSSGCAAQSGSSHASVSLRSSSH
jgi:hypothetical protein